MKSTALFLGFAFCAIIIYGQQTGSFNDPRDRKVYKTVKIGNQIWFAENLAYKNSTGCWAYNDNVKNVSTFGYLYDWKTAKNVCPSGWHLPSDVEWKKLTDFLGGEVEVEMNLKNVKGASNAGGKMKERGTAHWASPNAGAINSSGFTALPGSCRYPSGSFYIAGTDACFWTASEKNNRNAWGRFLYSKYGFVNRYADIKESGFSVRCVKDN